MNHSPKIPWFSGTDLKSGDATYELWRQEVKCLMEQNYDRDAILNAVRKSSRGEEGMVSMRLDLDANIDNIIRKLDSIYGSVDGYLDLAKSEKLPIVIHCRGDNYVLLTCLNMMKKKLNTEHHVHCHCFSGKMKDFLVIKGAFPNTKFRISPFLLMPNKYPNFKVDLCD